MKTVICDLCGKEIGSKGWTVNLIPPDIMVYTTTVDLCENCAADVEKHLCKKSKSKWESNYGQIEPR